MNFLLKLPLKFRFEEVHCIFMKDNIYHDKYLTTWRIVHIYHFWWVTYLIKTHCNAWKVNFVHWCSCRCTNTTQPKTRGIKFKTVQPKITSMKFWNWWYHRVLNWLNKLQTTANKCLSLHSVTPFFKVCWIISCAYKYCWSSIFGYSSPLSL